MGFLDSIDTTVLHFLGGIGIGFFLMVVSLIITVFLFRYTGRPRETAQRDGLPVPVQVRPVLKPVVRVVQPVPTTLVERPIKQSNSPEPPPQATANQRFWYYVTGREKPIPTLREALAMFPVEASKYTGKKNLAYDELSPYLQDNIRREEIVRGKGK